MSKSILLIAAGILVLGLGSSTLAVVMETVPVGNLGNGPDTRYETPGHGAVGYAYSIGKYEVTAGQYTEFLNAVAVTDTYGLYNPEMESHAYGCRIERSGSPGSYSYTVAGDQANRPVNYVSWGDAARFANWMHNGQPIGTQSLATTEDGAYLLDGATTNAQLVGVNREADWTWAVPSEDEWYKAAYHKNDGVTGNYFDYPTRSDSVPGFVDNSGNLSGTGTPFIEGGIDPGNYATYNGDSGAYGIGSPYYRSQVGEWENSGSPYGTFDQGGNVWEWNESISGQTRGLRAGSFDIMHTLMLASSSYSLSPAFEVSFIGFRVAEVPEPASLVLLAVGTLLAVGRRR
jgi:formylglycine-generating enzyme required for sulfatase activity